MMQYILISEEKNNITCVINGATYQTIIILFKIRELSFIKI